MGIVSIPKEIAPPLTCAICGVDLTLDKATAGLYDCNNRQAFACVSHFMEVEKLILGWADFITAELEKYMTLGDQPAQTLYGQMGSNGQSLIIEKGLFGANPSPKDLARHLFTRMSCGKVVIIAENPEVMKAVLRKQWLKLARKVQRERSSTLNATRVPRLGDMATRMRTMRFTTVDCEADVLIISRYETRAIDCQTVYITCGNGGAQLNIWVGMRKTCLIVICLFPHH